MRSRLDNHTPIQHEHDVGVREARQAMRAEDDGDPLLRAVPPARTRAGARRRSPLRSRRRRPRRDRRGRGERADEAPPPGREPTRGAAAGRRRSGCPPPRSGCPGLAGTRPHRPRWRPAGSPAGEHRRLLHDRWVERDVLPERSREQQRVLRQIADDPTALAGGQLVERCAVDEDCPRGDRYRRRGSPGRARSSPTRPGRSRPPAPQPERRGSARGGPVPRHRDTETSGRAGTAKPVRACVVPRAPSAA